MEMYLREPKLVGKIPYTSEFIRTVFMKKYNDAFSSEEAPLLSVIIPTCNRPALLDRSLSSICAQHYSNVEIIVVNDAGSPVEHVVRKHNRRGHIHYLVHASNKGASAARNSGLRLAKGHYIAYLDDDDEYLPEHLSEAVAALSKSPHRFAYTRAEYLIETEQDGQLQVVRQRPFSNINYDRNLLMIGNFIPTPTWVFERSLIDEVGDFDETFKAWEDWEWLIRASKKTDFLSVPIYTVEVHQRPNDHDHLGVKHRPEMRQWFEQVYAKHPAPIPELASARTEHLKRLFPNDDTEVVQPQFNSIPAIEGMGLEEPAFSAAKQGNLEIIDLINSAERLAQAQRLDLAAELYRLWLNHTVSPLSYAVAFNLGTVLEKAGFFEEAEQAFRRSLASNAQFAQARFGLAIQLERRGNIEEALAHLRWITHQENGVKTRDPGLHNRSLESLQRLTS